jgi:hypothetical protein
MRVGGVFLPDGCPMVDGKIVVTIITLDLIEEGTLHLRSFSSLSDCSLRSPACLNKDRKSW